MNPAPNIDEAFSQLEDAREAEFEAFDRAVDSFVTPYLLEAVEKANKEIANCPTHHRVWFKVWFNPILRRLFNRQIVSCFEGNRLVGYRLQRWKL